MREAKIQNLPINKLMTMPDTIFYAVGKDNQRVNVTERIHALYNEIADLKKSLAFYTDENPNIVMVNP